MNEPWQIYYEELHERAADIPEQRFNRVEDFREAVHEAYESTVDRLVNLLDYPHEDALQITKAFGRTVEDWIAEEEYDWDELQGRLEARQDAWGSAQTL